MTQTQDIKPLYSILNCKSVEGTSVRMKLTITTLTGDKFDVEVKAEDKVKDVKVSTEGQIFKEIDTSFHMLMIMFFCSHCTQTSGGCFFST